jgi:FtsH-binding integral membrane protein
MAITAFKDRYNTDGKLISDRAFYCVVAATLFFGFFVNAIEVIFLFDFFASWNVFVFTIVYIVMALAGVLINVISRNPIISFIGYCMVVLPIGALLSLVLPLYGYYVVRSAFLACAFVTGAMVLLAIVYPKIFYSMIQIVGLCLLIALIYQFIAIFTGFGIGGIIDWLIVLLFCCYIGLDVSYARNRPKTLDNAVDSACGLYLDIINLFIRLLAIISRNSNR